MGLATLLGGFLSISHAAKAQGGYADDALLYMRQNPSGTARTLGLAGSSSSLGADFGNLTSNPAGLGFFTKSEFTITPGVGYGTAKSTQVANAAAVGTDFSAQSQTANSFHIASIGLVFANRRPDNDNGSDWRGGAFALGFTRLADFNQSFGYRNSTDNSHSFFRRLSEPYGYTNVNSNEYQQATDDIASQQSANQYTNIDGLAYGTGLTDQTQGRNPTTGAPTGIFQVVTQPRSGTITQDELVKTTGSVSQFDLGYGGNYRDRLYIGGGIGVVFLNRTRTSTFSESSSGAQDFQSVDYLKTTGVGFNARIGLIYRVVDAVRLGASIQTPTYIELTDEYNTTLAAKPAYVASQQGAVSPLTTTPGTFDYSITTPFRATGGATVLIGKYGFLTGDIEYVGYSSAKFNTRDGSVDSGLDNANVSITNGYKNVINLRGGAEARLDIFRVRVGYAYYADPYVNSSYGRAQNYFTGGLGIRTKTFFVDLAGVYLDTKDQYQPYSLASVASPVVNITNNRFTTSLTGGFIF